MINTAQITGSGFNTAYLIINVLINNSLHIKTGLACRVKCDNITRIFLINQRVAGLRFFATLKNLTQPTFLTYCLFGNYLLK